jgi:signal transduction histidine kinase
MTDPTARLLATTRRRLFIVTLGLVALLVVGIGAASAIVALRALDADVDRALALSVEGAVATLGEEIPSDDEAHEHDEGILASADTFLLVLDRSGEVVSNPSGVDVEGLPDAAAVAAADAHGRDLRTVQVGGTDVRLLTVPIEAEHDSGTPAGYVQGGFVLTLHDEQSRSIVAAVLLVGVVGLLGAAVVTLIVTGRALVPIRRSFAAQRRFVADASHELRTPAALIRANAEVMEREGLVADEGAPLVNDIITEADRLGRLVGDLLQLASTDAHGLTIEPHPLDLAAVATETVRQSAALAADRGAVLAMGGSTPGPAIVTGDRDRLIQLVLILLDNAFDHSPPGGTVTVDVHASGPSVHLTVADEGPGIPPTERERIFEPFTRLPGVRRERAGGTGLGLAIARRIATAHHGTIHATDAPSGGAVFVVTLPGASA